MGLFTYHFSLTRFRRERDHRRAEFKPRPFAQSSSRQTQPTRSRTRTSRSRPLRRKSRRAIVHNQTKDKGLLGVCLCSPSPHHRYRSSRDGRAQQTRGLLLLQSLLPGSARASRRVEGGGQVPHLQRCLVRCPLRIFCCLGLPLQRRSLREHQRLLRPRVSCSRTAGRRREQARILTLQG